MTQGNFDNIASRHLTGRKPAKAYTWITIRSRTRTDALALRGSWRTVSRAVAGAALTRVPPGVDLSLLTPAELIALADRLLSERRALRAKATKGE